MALEHTVQDLHTQNDQLQDLFLNISKGQEEVKALLIESMIEKNPEDNKDGQLKQLQAEIATMRIQMLGQMALIQNLARGQEDLRILINKLHQGECNRMEQMVRIEDQVINQSPIRQEVGLVKSRPFWIATTSRAQQRPL